MGRISKSGQNTDSSIKLSDGLQIDLVDLEERNTNDINLKQGLKNQKAIEQSRENENVFDHLYDTSQKHSNNTAKQEVAKKKSPAWYKILDSHGPIFFYIIGWISLVIAVALFYFTLK